MHDTSSFPLSDSPFPPLLLASPARGVRTARHCEGAVSIVGPGGGDVGWILSVHGELFRTMTSRFRFSYNYFSV